jgi:two-component system, NarL family, sensor histidine kinase BarA
VLIRNRARRGTNSGETQLISVKRSSLRLARQDARAALVLCVFALVLIGALWGLAIVEIANERRRVEADAYKDAENFSRAFDEHTVRTIQSADQVVQFLKFQYENRSGAFDVNQYINAGLLSNDIFNLYSIIDANGDVVSSSKPFTTVNLSDREHFRVHVQKDSNSLFISKPVLGRVSKKWSLQMTRRLNDRQGNFAGVVVVSMDPFYFARFYHEFTMGRAGAITLLGTDGIVRVRQVGDEASVGQDLSTSPTFMAMKENALGRLRATSRIDGTERLMAYRRLAGYPLYVSVGLSTKEILAPLEEYKQTVHGMAWLTTLMVVAFCAAMLRMIRRLERSRRTALEASEAKSQFLANMSHELRTPLNGILGYAELLQSDLVDPEQRRFARAIETSGNHLLSLVNTVLDMERVASGKMEVVVAPANLRELVVEVVSAHRSSALAKKLLLLSTVEPTLPETALCDRVKLVQVLNNLMHNAIKFTDKGSVGLTLSRQGVDLLITVADTGPGIAKALHTAVFEKFVQVDSSDGRAHGGTGLGLAIVKEMVELMGGQVTIESSIGAGSKFCVRVPVLSVEESSCSQLEPAKALI